VGTFPRKTRIIGSTWEKLWLRIQRYHCPCDREALVTPPEVVPSDKATGALDPKTNNEVLFRIWIW